MSHFDRRSVLGYSFWGAGAALSGLPAYAATGDPAWNPYSGDKIERWIIDDTSAVADTDSGKVAGSIRNDVRIFKGIPYKEILSPEGRWVRGAKVRPWTGKRISYAIGPVCPEQDFSSPTENEIALRDSDLLPKHTGEDCLRINVWTPSLDNKKRQVLFYLHGGGFSGGSPLMAARYEGNNLAKYGDVVVVSITHRLNALGFLDLTAYGARFSESRNLGMFDVIDALKWVRTNIAGFGGDPSKVMIFGHSGGASKVLTLLSMPEAKGLFNRAVAHSPGEMPYATPEQGAALAASFLKLVELSPNNIDALYKLPVERITASAIMLSQRSMAARERYGQWPPVGTPANIGWGPVVDGRTVLYQATGPTVSSDIPLLIGTTLHENFGALGHPEYSIMNEVQAREITRTYFGPVGDPIYNVYRDIFPKATAYELSAMARGMGYHRAYCVKAAQRRSAFNASPTYNYWFHWRANTFGGRAMSHHEIEMPLVFANCDVVPSITGGAPEAKALSLKIVDAWLAFARTGNPNTKALPNWSPVTPKATTSMVFDSTCRIDHGSDMAAIEMFWKDRFPKA